MYQDISEEKLTDEKHINWITKTFFGYVVEQHFCVSLHMFKHSLLEKVYRNSTKTKIPQNLRLFWFELILVYTVGPSFPLVEIVSKFFNILDFNPNIVNISGVGELVGLWAST